MIQIDLQQDIVPKNERIPVSFLRKLEQELSAITTKHGLISILFVDDEEIQRLNRMYRKKNEVTDVLSFGYKDADLLGDIAISWPQTVRQSGGDDALEASDLIIHGCLHVLGYDHEDPVQAKEMFSIQDKLLNTLL